jgi:hypothetical protein
MYSLVLSLVTGTLAFLALFFQRNLKQARVINYCVLFVGAVAVGSLAYTGNLGGQIRHTEIRAENASVGTGSSEPASSEAASPEAEEKSESHEDHD